MNEETKQILSQGGLASGDFVSQQVLLDALRLKDEHEYFWSLIIPMSDSELVKYNGANLKMFFYKHALFYEKVSDNIEVEGNFYKGFTATSTFDIDDVTKDYGDVSDEIRSIVQAANYQEEDETWKQINLFTVGSVKRSDLASVQLSLVDNNHYRLSVNSTTTDLVMYFNNKGNALTVASIIEAYRDYDNFLEVAQSLFPNPFSHE